MKMETVLEDVVEALQDKNLNVLAARTGIHNNTIRNIRDGNNINPTLNVIKTLHKYLGL